MSCFRPLSAFRRPGGEVGIGPCPADARWMELPCGKCIGCKLDRARAWSVRIMHEAQLYRANLCLTLTYSDESLPVSLSLEYPHFQAFMKRVRRNVEGESVGPDGGRPIRFFVAGEYGDKFGRPHYHAILFNTWFPDMRRLHNGKFSSSLVDELWEDRGNVVIDSLSPAAAAYVAGYTLKKARNAAYMESTVSKVTGELGDRRPPFVVMSRRPGIGAWWFRKYGSDLFPHDFAVAEGQRYKVPRYYVERFKAVGDPGTVEEMMLRRWHRAEEQKSESTPARRAVREAVARSRAELFDNHSL